ncbi:MAG: ribose 5-phosphate isomerase B [Clostridia bacterium]|nr:ribose 5-phosphate isomerase B [Clostridia bacterium]
MTNRDNKIIALASDHAGYPLKEALIKYLNSRGIDTIDCGTSSTESCDYPDFAVSGCCKVLDGEADLTILCCGTGIGMSMAANKLRGIRAACCSDVFSAKYTRLHNNANVLCLGARVVGEGLAAELVDAFIDTGFEGGKHQRRVDMITALEK